MMLQNAQSLLDRIRQLEQQLKYLEQHHQQCSIHKQSRSENEISLAEATSTCLTVISFIPQPSESQQAQRIPQWQKTANHQFKDVPSAHDWDMRRKEAKLFTVDENHYAIAAISGSVLPSWSQLPMPTDPDLGPIDLARSYARMAKSSEGNAAFTCCLHSFHELVFVSLCAVLEASGHPVDKINETMRIYVTNTEDTNLKRLRHGARWANSAICSLAEAGWGDRATELFLLCGWSVKKFAAFGQNRKSLPYFVNHLKQRQYIPASKQSEAESLGGKHDLPTTKCERVPYSIPAFIKIWFGDWFEVSKICQYLGYHNENDLEHITRLCREYITLQKSVTAPGSERESLPKRKADTTQFSNRTKEARIHEPDAEPCEQHGPADPMLACEQTDTARPVVSLNLSPQQESPPIDDHTYNNHSSSSVVNQIPAGDEDSTPVLSRVNITEGRQQGTFSHDPCSSDVPDGATPIGLLYHAAAQAQAYNRKISAGLSQPTTDTASHDDAAYAQYRLPAGQDLCSTTGPLGATSLLMPTEIVDHANLIVEGAINHDLSTPWNSSTDDWNDGFDVPPLNSDLHNDSWTNGYDVPPAHPTPLGMWDATTNVYLHPSTSRAW